ncbi:hypothetical protein R1flu_002935 [Riccia fluitans]|uniref:Uncharacterized protein n=1 Tax=Riccia fluitans TaxID=41844 RepID=A0ABD1Y825_9MARC
MDLKVASLGILFGTDTISCRQLLQGLLYGLSLELYRSSSNCNLLVPSRRLPKDLLAGRYPSDATPKLGP